MTATQNYCQGYSGQKIVVIDEICQLPKAGSKKLVSGEFLNTLCSSENLR